MKKKLLAIILSVFMTITAIPMTVLADDEFTVTYDANGGTGTVPVDSNTYSSGDEVTVLANEDLTNSGYVFDGWNTMSDGRGDHYQAGHKFNISKNTTLYAIWTEPKVRIQIVPSKDSATGTVEYKFDTDENFTTYSGDAPISIPYGATKITFKAIPDESFVLLDCTILYKGEDIDEEKGYKEIILAAQDTTNYGIDFDGKRRLPELLRKLSLIDGIETIRVMYGYMDGIDDELINEMKTNKKVAHYLDIPIQHGDSAVLKSMNRRETAEKITEVITKLRKEIPGSGILKSDDPPGALAPGILFQEEIYAKERKSETEAFVCAAYSFRRNGRKSLLPAGTGRG